MNGNQNNNDVSIWKIIAVIVVISLFIGLVALSYSDSSSSSSSREMGRCWICGKKGSYKMDGSFYCHEHYNDRLFGRIG